MLYLMGKKNESVPPHGGTQFLCLFSGRNSLHCYHEICDSSVMNYALDLVVSIHSKIESICHEYQRSNPQGTKIAVVKSRLYAAMERADSLKRWYSSLTACISLAHTSIDWLCRPGRFCGSSSRSAVRHF